MPVCSRAHASSVVAGRQAPSAAVRRSLQKRLAADRAPRVRPQFNWSFGQLVFAAALAPNATFELSKAVRSAPATPEGVYFTRHRVEFDYPNFTVPGEAAPRQGHFVMVSRGHLTDGEWASLNYTDLEGTLAALNISGIVPDSSFSIKLPAPLWPLAVLVAATVAAGTLALAEYLVATDPEKHGRLNRALLQLAGKWHILRVSVAEELRARLKRRPAGK